MMRFFLFSFCILFGVVHSIAALAQTVPAENQQGKVIYLTFDADMTRSMEKRAAKREVVHWYSPGLIAYLEAEQVPATIFMTGLFAQTYPALAKELGAQPYIRIENHTYDHAAFEPKCFGLPEVHSDTEKLREMADAQKTLIAITGQTPRYIRHPGLCHMPHDDALATKERLVVSDGGIISGDAFLTSAQRIAANTVRQLGKNNSIIMHLGGPHAPGTEQALKMLIPALKEKGYSFAHF